MCKRLGVIFGLLCLLIFTGCRKKEFTVQFDLPADVNETVTLIYYASDPEKGFIVEQVVTINKGKAKVVTPGINPSMVCINRAGAAWPSAVFYAERGDNFKITGKGSDPLLWDIRGNGITDRLSEWRIASAKAIEEWRGNQGKGCAALNSAVAKYVAAHPDDPVSAILLLTAFDRRHDEKGFDAAWAKLAGDAKEGKWIDLASRTDMLEYDPATKLPAKILLKTTPNGCDTIVPGRVPVMLCFTSRNIEAARADKDTIRRLSRQFSDSSKRVIAEISFEKDSMSRVYNARRDSFTNVVRAWMPLGISDSTARVLGVNRVPWVIVIDKKKKILYSGSDLRMASDAFRKELK